MIELTPCLWFHDQAEEAIAFYVATIPGSRILRRASHAADTPGGPAESVVVIDCELAGTPVTAFAAAGGSGGAFSPALSLMLLCDTQAEIDRLWDALGDGGRAQACGWLTDRYGLSWQITPRRLLAMIAAPDRVAAARATQAMLAMVKLELATLERAFAGQDRG